MDGKFPGAVALKLSNAQWCGQKFRGQMPHPQDFKKIYLLYKKL